MNFSKKNSSFSLLGKHHKKNKFFVSKMIFKTTIILLLALVTYSCSEDGTNPIEDNVFLSAKINGLDFNTSIVVAISAPIGNNNFALSLVGGIDSNSETITIIVGNYDGTGTYTTESNSGIIFTYSNPSSGITGIWASSSNGVGTGTITITEDNATSLKGTFSFTGINVDDTTKSITEGRFFSPLKSGI